ncbi:MAG: helix-turn-helix transcriptional regulator [Clostridia bacterium]|nr:helix-turn-helix transcriptional regulator [Clostridia bacterium]
MRGMSQEQLAERADISRTYLSMIEAPNTVCSFTLDVLYNIADALGMDAAELLKMKLPDITKSEQMQHGADD